jgi:hypothetical protein
MPAQQQASRRWTIAMFYDITNVIVVNALVIYAHKMSKVQPEKEKGKCFCSEMHMI